MRDKGPSGERSGGPVGSPVGGETSRDELFRALAHARRRRVLAYLRAERRTVPVEQVVDHLATAGADTLAARREIETSLYHVHLPKLIDVGLVAWDDPDRQAAIYPTTVAVELPTALEWVPVDPADTD
jgi:hypothetical protein